MSCIAGERPISGRLVAGARRSGAASRARRRLGERAADDRDQLLQVERLGQIFEGAALGRA